MSDDDTRKKMIAALKAAEEGVVRRPKKDPTPPRSPSSAMPDPKTSTNGDIRESDEGPVDPLGQTVSQSRIMLDSEREDSPGQRPPMEEMQAQLREQEAEQKGWVAGSEQKEGSEKPDKSEGWESRGGGKSSKTFCGKGKEAEAQNSSEHLSTDEFMQWYNDLFVYTRDAITEVMDSLSEHAGGEELKILFTMKPDGKYTFETISPEEVKGLVDDHLGKKLKNVKITQAPDDEQHFFYKDGIPPFVPADDRLRGALNSLVALKSQELAQIHVSHLRMVFTLKKTKRIYLKEFTVNQNSGSQNEQRAAKAKQILSEEILGTLQKYKSAKQIKFPRSADSVDWTFEKKIEVTVVKGLGNGAPASSLPDQEPEPTTPEPSAEPVPLDRPKRPTPAPVAAPIPVVKPVEPTAPTPQPDPTTQPAPQPAPLGPKPGVQDPGHGTEGPAEDSQVRRLGPYEVRFREQVRTVAKYTVRKIDPDTGETKELDTIEFETTGKGPMKKVVADEVKRLAVRVEVQDGKPVLTELGVTEQEPVQEQEPLSFRNQWEAAAGGAVLAGTIVGLLPYSVQWLASKFSFLSSIKVPDQVYSIPSSYIVAAVASLVALGSGLIVWRDTKKKKQQVNSNDS